MSGVFLDTWENLLLISSLLWGSIQERYLGWLDNTAPNRYGILIKNLSARDGIPPYELLAKEALRHLK